MKFKIGKSKYKLLEKENLELENTIGLCKYVEKEIHIKKLLNNKLKKATLIHELTHAFMFENAHTRESFTQEDICDLFGAYAEDVVNYANKYFGD